MTDDDQDYRALAASLFGNAQNEQDKSHRVTISSTEEDQNLRDFAARLFGRDTDN